MADDNAVVTPKRAPAAFWIPFLLWAGVLAALFSRPLWTDERTAAGLPTGLDPLVLDDRREMSAYQAQFPVGDYDLIDVPQLGKFYIDKNLGQDTIKDNFRVGRLWEPGVQDMLRLFLRPGACALDIGAHIGIHSLLMGNLVGPEGRVYAFEPQKKLFRELVSNVKVNGLSQVVPLRYALGRWNTVVEMDPAIPGNEGGTHVGKGGDKVELRTVDSFGFGRLDLIKIDVEHFESEVIDGARQTITRTHPLILLEIMGGIGLLDADASQRAVIKNVILKLNRLKYSVRWISGHDYLAVPVEPYRYGQQLVFSKRGSAEGHLMGVWAGGEPWGRWSMDGKVGIAVVLAAPPKRDLVLTAVVPRYVAWKDSPQQVVDVYANDQLVDTWLFGESAPADPQRVTIIARDAVSDTYLHIGLVVRHQVAIAAISDIDDRRVVGIGVQQMVIGEYNPAAASAR